MTHAERRRSWVGGWWLVGVAALTAAAGSVFAAITGHWLLATVAAGFTSYPWSSGSWRSPGAGGAGGPRAAPVLPDDEPALHRAQAGGIRPGYIARRAAGAVGGGVRRQHPRLDIVARTHSEAGGAFLYRQGTDRQGRCALMALCLTMTPWSTSTSQQGQVVDVGVYWLSLSS